MFSVAAADTELSCFEKGKTFCESDRDSCGKAVATAYWG